MHPTTSSRLGGQRIRANYTDVFNTSPSPRPVKEHRTPAIRNETERKREGEGERQGDREDKAYQMERGTKETDAGWDNTAPRVMTVSENNMLGKGL